MKNHPSFNDIDNVLFHKNPEPMGLSTVLPDLRFVMVNKAFQSATGYSVEEVVGKTIPDLNLFVNPEKQKAAAEKFQAEGSIKQQELQIRCKDGTIIDGLFSGDVINLQGQDYFLTVMIDITRRKKSEEELRHRLVYEKMLLQISNMAVPHENLEQFLTDSLTIMGETLDISRAYIFEYHHKTDSTDNIFEWCAPDESPQKDNLQGLPSGSVPWWMGTLKDGGIICFSDIENIPDEGAKELLRPQGICSILVVPLFVAGRFYGFIGFDECRFHREWPEEDLEILLAISRIIAEAAYKKQSEEEIERERQQLLSIFNSVEEVIYISDPETYEILYANPKLVNILHRNCVGGLCYKEIQGLDEPCAFCTNDIILKQKPQPHYWEYYNPKLEKHFSIVDRIFAWPDGRNVRFEMAMDITERKQAEQALAESETRFKALHNASFGGIAIHDQGIILECNQGLSEMTGYQYSELIGMDGLLLIAAISREAVMNNIRTGYEKPYEAFGLRKNGEEFHLQLEARNVPYQGKQVRTVEFRDITERKQAEAEREKLQSQLIQAQKMESIGRLAGGVAHEFNNMLNVMLGYTELAMDTPGLSDKLYNYLQQVFKAGTQSAEVTRQLTAYARQQTIAPRKLDLNANIADMIKVLRALTEEGVSLDWQPSEGLWPVKIDPAQVNQLLTNLCVNAGDAIAGTGRITIKTEKVTLGKDDCVDHDDTSPGDFVLLSVSDNGCGMDQQTLTNLFEPFFTTKAVGRGTGLGLAMVYGIVKQNKGLIQVDSKPDLGSTFRIFLPRDTDDDSGNKKETDHSARPRSYGETVLVAEDKESLLTMTRDMLESLGYKVLTTNVPEEALRLAEKHSGVIDLLITDVIMPGTNGRELAEQVKALYPNIKCLYMSGHTADIITRHGVLPEGDSFIQKPFSWKAFAHKVRRILTDR